MAACTCAEAFTLSAQTLDERALVGSVKTSRKTFGLGAKLVTRMASSPCHSKCVKDEWNELLTNNMLLDTLLVAKLVLTWSAMMPTCDEQQAMTSHLRLVQTMLRQLSSGAQRLLWGKWLPQALLASHCCGRHKRHVETYKVT